METQHLYFTRCIRYRQTHKQWEKSKMKSFVAYMPQGFFICVKLQRKYTNDCGGEKRCYNSKYNRLYMYLGTKKMSFTMEIINEYFGMMIWTGAV